MAKSASGARPDGEGMRRRIEKAVRQYHEEHDHWPTYRDIGAAIGVEAPSHVKHHVDMLVKQGILTHQPNISRSISLVRSDDTHARPSPTRVRILGRIAAGAPLDLFDPGEAEELEIGDPVNGSSDDGIFALEVVGDSMIEDGILNGDLVLVRPAVSAPNGAIAVVEENRANGGHGAATLKHFYKEDGQICLQPANSAHQPIVINPTKWDSDWRVRGIAIGVFRRFGGKW
jgi:repressor LexA